MNKVINHTYKATVTGIIILISTLFSFEICYRLNLNTPWYLILVPVSFTIGNLFYTSCHKISESLMNRISQNILVDSQNLLNSQTPTNSEYSLKQRYELFHDQFEKEHQQFTSQKNKSDEEKLKKILEYTRMTFNQLGFNQEEVFMICESVEYFIKHKAVLKSIDIHIQQKPNVTQISLKNFAWNIANQYNIKGIITAEFIIATFREWFKDSTISTVAKNLRTTNGRHMIEIDENLCK